MEKLSMRTLTIIITLAITVICFSACNDSEGDNNANSSINQPQISYNHLPEDAEYDGVFIFISADEQDLLADLAQTLDEDSEYLELLERIAYGEVEEEADIVDE